MIPQAERPRGVLAGVETGAVWLVGHASRFRGKALGLPAPGKGAHRWAPRGMLWNIGDQPRCCSPPAIDAPFPSRVRCRLSRRRAWARWKTL